MSYYNTTHLTADQLRDAIASCNRQEIRVRQLYRQYGDMTPSECWDKYGSSFCPITSIRRTITDLTDKGLLHKTGKLKPGPYGKPEHVWTTAAPSEELFDLTRKEMMPL